MYRIQVTLYIMIIYYDLSNSLECSLKNNVVVPNNTTDCSRECKFPARPRVCEFEFTIAWWYTMAAGCLDCPDSKSDCSAYQCYAVDGSQVPILLVNELSPGPSIQVCHGDIIRVKVKNQMQDGSSLTIHWHGMHQFETVWADGVPMITQCPIPSSSSFVYKFVADPPGTHWWHSHVGVQRGDGVYGALIVRVPRQTEIIINEYDFDLPEHHMIFDDWTNLMSLDAFMLSAANADPSNPRTMTIITNGKGFNDNIGVDVPVSVFEVEQGYRYRMRAINAAFGECNIKVTIESHPITIIANDGFELDPVHVDAFVFAPGERIDFVLEASAKPSSYCIYLTNTSDLCPGKGRAILKYRNTEIMHGLNCSSFAPVVKNVFTTVRFLPEETGELTFKHTFSYHPVDPNLHFVDETFYLIFSLSKHTYSSSEHSYSSSYNMNGAEFMFPERPFVSLDGTEVNTCRLLPNSTEVQSDMGDDELKCTILIKVKLGQVVELIMIDDGSITDHPMHMHGQSFRVLAQGNYDLDVQDLIFHDKTVGLKRLPLDSTVVKDTLNIPAHGYGIIRWKAENPGYWFFHCHIEYHSLLGMAVVIQVGDDDDIPAPPQGFPACGPWSPE